MKITFIGTSHGVPSAERHCSCILLESGGAFYFIDAGAPIADVIQRRGLDMQAFKAIFTTHAHGDHCSGLFQIADLMNWYYKSASADFFVTDREQSDAIEALINISCNRMGVDKARIRFNTVNSGEVYRDENISVSYVQNMHMTSSPSYSILVQEGEKKYLFSGDLSGGLRERDLPHDLLSCGVDAFISELAHFSFDDLAPYIEKANIGGLFITHVYPTDKYDEIEKIKGKYSFPIFTPSDGDAYEI